MNRAPTSPRDKIDPPAPIWIRNARAARRARLSYGADDRPGYERRGRVTQFHYLDKRGRRIRDAAVLERIRKLVIPPAWTDVWINPSPRGHIQATGRDVRGRKQYIYHADWRESRDATKFKRLVAFAEALPRIRSAVHGNLRRRHMDRDRIVAIAIRLLETALIRVGNDEYARTNGSYGLTTLRVKHARVGSRKVQFHFRGKSGLAHHIELSDAALARQVSRLQELPGQDLFCYLDGESRCRRLRSDDVNRFLRLHSGRNFTAKDFRTWAGTLLAALTLAQLPVPQSKTAARRAVTGAMREVASRLGNTPAVTRRSYVHPAIIEAFVGGTLPRLPAPDQWPDNTKSRGLAPEERAVLSLLRRAAKVRIRP